MKLLRSIRSHVFQRIAVLKNLAKSPGKTDVPGSFQTKLRINHSGGYFLGTNMHSEDFWVTAPPAE